MLRRIVSLAALALCMNHCDRRPDRSADRAGVDASNDSAADSAVDVREERARTCTRWTTVDRGVTERSCDDDAPGIVIGMAGWKITGASTEQWIDELARSRLDALGASSYFAVEGPRSIDFHEKELGLDALRTALERRVARAPAAWVLIVAHSSGAHVARTLFHRAFASAEESPLRGRVVYVDLDGDRGIDSDPERSFSERSTSGLRHAIFVAGEHHARRLRGFSMDAMREGARALGPRAELFVYDSSGSGCTSNACVHLSLVNTRPYPRGDESYARFAQGPVNTAWLSLAERWFTR